MIIETIAYIAAFITSFLFFIFTWKVYHHFWSLADAVHESNFSYFTKKLTISLVVAFFPGVLVISSILPQDNDATIQLKSESDNQSIPIKNENLAFPSENINVTESFINESNDKNTMTDSKILNNSIIHDEKLETKTELEKKNDTETETKLEEKANITNDNKDCLEYSGDDEIIKKRLGCIQ